MSMADEDFTDCVLYTRCEGINKKPPLMKIDTYNQYSNNQLTKKGGRAKLIICF